jgi:hypothetical protein
VPYDSALARIVHRWLRLSDGAQESDLDDIYRSLFTSAGWRPTLAETPAGWATSDGRLRATQELSVADKIALIFILFAGPPSADDTERCELCAPFQPSIKL